jgi:hypothetical protein
MTLGLASGAAVPKSSRPGAIVEGKESDHVASNDLLIGCLRYRQHRVHCHDFN